ncbi:MAG TPA: hypothetical protein VGL81_21645 [Polyangiaceae bacterium]|jgi:hypothetical protein
MSIPALREARLTPAALPTPAPPPPTSTPASRPTDKPTDTPSPFAQLLRGLGHQVQGSESTVHQAISSAQMGELKPAELIALQAGVYRYSEAVDLASRLVENAATALKTVLQGQ